jgi:hypothetical protein
MPSAADFSDVPYTCMREQGSKPQCWLRPKIPGGRPTANLSAVSAKHLGVVCPSSNATPKDPTIRAKFNSYRFADHKERVIELLMRVTHVSVETLEIVEAMKNEER